jgi:hypothetical protein
VRPPADPASDTDAEYTRLVWAAIMLATRVEACDSILRGDPVLGRHLDAQTLRHALRGRPLPNPDDYIEVTRAMLDAINEAAAPK